MSISCPHCLQSVLVQDRFLGADVTCPHCAGIFTAIEQPAASSPVIRLRSQSGGGLGVHHVVRGVVWTIVIGLIALRWFVLTLAALKGGGREIDAASEIHAAVDLLSLFIVAFAIDALTRR